MAKIATTALVLALGLAVATPAFADKEHKGEKDKEQKISLGDCPQAVQKAIKDEAGTGTIGDVEKEVKGGKTVYEADVKKADGKEYDVKVAEDGKVLKVQAEEDEKEGKDKDGDKDDDDDKDDNK